jgi:hypothetical protein
MVHLSHNIRHAINCPRTGALLNKLARGMRKNPQSSDFGVEYAVYMMDLTADNGNVRRDQALGNTDKTGFPNMLWKLLLELLLAIRTLTHRASAPIRPRFPRRT